jgi:cytochrome c biogenesis protein CcdA
VFAGLTLAFTAGLVSTVNPCGFAMLPAYLGYFIGLDEGQKSRTEAVARGLAIGAVVSAGFLLVFGLAGALLVLGLQTVRTVVPYAALVIGAGLVVLGIALLRGYYLNIRIPMIKRASTDQTYPSFFLFGITYAIASLSCTLPVFLSVVVVTFTQQSFLGGFASFLTYTLGMSAVLIALTLALSLGKDSLVRRLRGSARHINKLSGAILVLAGAFVVFYWTVILTTGAQDLNRFGIARFVETLSAQATRLIGGHPLLLAAGLGAAIIAAVAYVRSGRRREHVDDDATGPDEILTSAG